MSSDDNRDNLEAEKGVAGQPPIHWHNLFILTQMQLQAASLVIIPANLILAAGWTAVIAWGFCTPEYGVPMQRLGSIWISLGFFYVLVEEVWKVTPQSIHQEIEGSLALIDDGLDGAAVSKMRYRQVAETTERWRLPVVRGTEILLVVGGTLLSGFGDFLAVFA